MSVAISVRELLLEGLSFIRKIFSTSVDEHSGPVKEVYVKWDNDTNFIMAFVAEHFKTSNKELIESLSHHMGRSQTSVLRKISRLRGIETGKSPYSSVTERKFVNDISKTGLENRENLKLFMMSLMNAGLSDNEIMDFQDIMLKSEPRNKLNNRGI